MIWIWHKEQKIKIVGSQLLEEMEFPPRSEMKSLPTLLPALFLGRQLQNQIFLGAKTSKPDNSICKLWPVLSDQIRLRYLRFSKMVWVHNVALYTYVEDQLLDRLISYCKPIGGQ